MEKPSGSSEPQSQSTSATVSGGLASQEHCEEQQTAIGARSRRKERRRIIGWKDPSGYQLAWIPRKTSHGPWIQSFRTRSQAIDFLRDQGNCLLVEPAQEAEEIENKLLQLLQWKAADSTQEQNAYTPNDPAEQKSSELVRIQRIVVTWLVGNTRHLAWGSKGSSIIEGQEVCTYHGRYEALLESLTPFQALVCQLPKQRHLAIDVGRSIEQGCFIPLQAEATAKPQRRGHSAGGLTPGDFRKAQPQMSGESSISEEIQRNEALVVRSDGSISGPAALRRRRSEVEAREKERQRLLSEQRREVKRLEWFRKHGIDEPDAPDDLMRRALQGGSPGLKK
jgi:hypothetical protein